jgi:hypothetical protein
VSKKLLSNRSYNQRAQLGSEITPKGNIATWTQENGVHEVSVYTWEKTDYWHIGTDYEAAKKQFDNARTNG